MKLKDGTILMHDGAPYDPVKAHEYYIKTRKLKGRKKGTNQTVPVRAHTRNLSKGNYTVRLSNGRTVTLTRQQLVEQQVYAAKRVSDIKKRLIELSVKLKTMLKEAEKKKANTDKKPTAADKRKSAKESKQYRQKHKQQLINKAKNKQVKKTPPKKTTTSTDPVVELKSKITEIRTRLKEAINVQRELTTAKLNN
jgi:glucan-binding YG repeat protein